MGERRRQIKSQTGARRGAAFASFAPLPLEGRPTFLLGRPSASFFPAGHTVQVKQVGGAERAREGAFWRPLAPLATGGNWRQFERPAGCLSAAEEPASEAEKQAAERCV